MGLPMIAMAMMAGGTAMETYGALEEGKQAAKVGKMQRQYYEAEARATEQAGLYDQRLLKERGRGLKAHQIAQMAAGGGSLSGTNLRTLARTAAAIEADAAVLGQESQRRAGQLRYRGAYADYAGKMARYGSRLRAAAAGGKGIGSMLLAARIGKRAYMGSKAGGIETAPQSTAQKLGGSTGAWPGTKWTWS